MDDHQTCFFCCKSMSINICDTSSSIKSKANKISPSILQISQYLKLPRNLVDQLKEENYSVLSSVCENCKEISETLGKLCRDFEVTKMKISHYLNLLNARITGKNDEDLNMNVESPVNTEEIELSDLQKCVHQKCSIKVRKHQFKVIPQLILSKCQATTSEPPQFEMDDLEQNDYPLILEAGENQIKIDQSADENPELYSCPFCNFTVNCGDQLNGHVTSQHSEQFESSATINSNSQPLEISSNCQVDLGTNTVHLSDSSKKTMKNCEICGMLIGSRNLARHKRIKHGDIAHQYISFRNGQMKNVKCDYCPLTFTTDWHKERHVNALHLRPPPQLVGMRMLRRCEICGAMARNMSAHKRVKHQNMDLSTDGIEEREILEQRMKFKCFGCGNGYSIRSSLTRHYRNSERCRMEKESEPMINDAIVMENLFENAEDPLQI